MELSPGHYSGVPVWIPVLLISGKRISKHSLLILVIFYISNN